MGDAVALDLAPIQIKELKNYIQIQNTIVYNTFPWLDISEQEEKQ